MRPEPGTERFSGSNIDVLLAHGWFRMGRYMYTVNHIGIEREIRVFWLCYDLTETDYPKSVRILQKRSQRFQFQCRDLVLNEELTNLYLRYRESIDLDAADSLEEVCTGRRLVAACRISSGARSLK